MLNNLFTRIIVSHGYMCCFWDYYFTFIPLFRNYSKNVAYWGNMISEGFGIILQKGTYKNFFLPYNMLIGLI